jgi:hypothetical protein
MSAEPGSPPPVYTRKSIPAWVRRVSGWVWGVIALIIGTTIAGLVLLIVESPSSPKARIAVVCEGPRSMKPGEVVILTYTISSSVARDVGLGAGLYDEAGDDHSTGFGDVDSLRIEKSPRNIAKRQFEIPAKLSAGRYEVQAEIWPANEVGVDPANTFAEGQCGSLTVR